MLPEHSYDETFFLSTTEYLAQGDKIIRNYPLINTSLRDLANCGWKLRVRCRWCPTLAHQRLLYHFYGSGEVNEYISFKLWVSGKYWTKEKILTLMHERDFTPRLNYPPKFDVRPKETVILRPELETVYVFDIKKITEEQELEVLQFINERRAKRVKGREYELPPAVSTRIVAKSA